MFDAKMQNESLVIEISGKLTGEACGELRRIAKEHFQDKSATQPISSVYLIFGHLSAIDSAGLGLLMGLKILCRRHKARLYLVCLEPDIRQSLASVGLHLMIDILDRPPYWGRPSIAAAAG